MSVLDSLRGLDIPSNWAAGGLGSGLSFGETRGPNVSVEDGKVNGLLSDDVASYITRQVNKDYHEASKEVTYLVWKGNGVD